MLVTWAHTLHLTSRRHFSEVHVLSGNFPYFVGRMEFCYIEQVCRLFPLLLAKDSYPLQPIHPLQPPQQTGRARDTGGNTRGYFIPNIYQQTSNTQSKNNRHWAKLRRYNAVIVTPPVYIALFVIWEGNRKMHFQQFFGNIISGYEKYVDICREFLKPHLWDLKRKKKRKEEAVGAVHYCILCSL